MRLRVALIVLALVVVPVVVFAVAKNRPATTVVGWTHYAPPGATVPPGTGHVSGTTTGETMAEKAAIKAAVAKWERRHPGGTCQIAFPDSAHCTTANGLPAELVVLVSTATAQSTAP